MATDSTTDEKKFIHDISSPIGVTYGMVEVVLDALKSSGTARPEDILRLEKALKSLDKVAGLLEQRREQLRSQAA